ncbi:MAG: pyruvate kinase, partial [bacterium]
ENPRPTRAEVSDIANAIYSKADAIMLSGETTFGKYPVESVKTMAKVAAEVEKSRGDMHDTPMAILSTETSSYLAKSAVEASIRLRAKAIIADTETGRAIRNLAGYRGRKLIYAQCYDKRVMRELALSFGVYANFMEPHEQHEFVINTLNALINKGCIKKTHQVVVLGGSFGLHHGASFIEISTAGKLLVNNNQVTKRD